MDMEGGDESLNLGYNHNRANSGDKDHHFTTHQLLHRVLRLLTDTSKTQSQGQPVALLKLVLSKCTVLEQRLEIIDGQLAELAKAKTTAGGRMEFPDLDVDEGHGHSNEPDRDDLNSDFEDEQPVDQEHEDTKPYQCKLCPISPRPPVFSEPQGLAEHYSTQHMVPDSSTTRQPPWRRENVPPPLPDFPAPVAANPKPAISIGQSQSLPKQMCDECGRSFHPRSLKQHKARHRLHGGSTTSMMKGSRSVAASSSTSKTKSVTSSGRRWRGRGKTVKWVKVASFPDAESALAAVKNEGHGIWKRWTTNNPRNGMKQLYTCKLSRQFQCEFKAMLHFETTTAADNTGGDVGDQSQQPQRQSMVTWYKSETPQDHNHDLTLTRDGGTKVAKKRRHSTNTTTTDVPDGDQEPKS